VRWANTIIKYRVQVLSRWATVATVPKHTNPEAFIKYVARRIGEVRRARGVTQEELAVAMGIAVRNVQRIESGQNLTLYTLARVAVALRADPSEFVLPPAARSPRR
jgi:ribosome-binding protein aMBF1 (putative translation factor)